MCFAERTKRRMSSYLCRFCGIYGTLAVSSRKLPLSARPEYRVLAHAQLHEDKPQVRKRRSSRRMTRRNAVMTLVARLLTRLRSYGRKLLHLFLLYTIRVRCSSNLIALRLVFADVSRSQVDRGDLNVVLIKIISSFSLSRSLAQKHTQTHTQHKYIAISYRPQKIDLYRHLVFLNLFRDQLLPILIL